MKALALVAVVMLAIARTGTSPADQDSEKVIQTKWMSSSELNALFSKLENNRYMLFETVGRSENGVVSYKAQFRPFPPDLDEFLAYWGMSDQHYRRRQLEAKSGGFEEVWHQSFSDDADSEIHQAVWIKLFGEDQGDPFTVPFATTGPSSAGEDSGKVIESEWITESEISALCDKLNNNRFVEFEIVGKIESGEISYKAKFKPYPPNLDGFKSSWGLSDRQYRRRQLEAKSGGYKQIWHHSFFDGENNEIHQGVWIKFFSDEPEGSRRREPCSLLDADRPDLLEVRDALDDLLDPVLEQRGHAVRHGLLAQLLDGRRASGSCASSRRWPPAARGCPCGPCSPVPPHLAQPLGR